MAGLREEQVAWSLFDAGCWGYVSVTLSCLLPLVLKQQTPASIEKYVSAVWANAVAVGTLLAGILCPFIGAMVDQLALRKVTVLVSGFVTCIFLSVAVSIDVEQWPAMVGFAVIGVMFYSLMQAVYNSLLVHVSETSEDEVVFVSAVQCAIGNFGAMVLMTALGLEEAKHSKKVIPIDYVQRCFLWSALWFFLFALPFAFVYQEEPRHGKVHNVNLTHQVRSAISAFKMSLQNRELLKYMIATLIYSDASSTLFSVYMVYAAQIGISNAVLLHCAVLNRWINVFMGFGWYYLSRLIGSRVCFLLSMSLTLLSAIACAVMHTDFDFWVMNLILSLAGSGGYIFSRVLLARLTTKDNTAQHFGFMAGVSRVSGMLGPLLYAAIIAVGGARAALVGLAVFSVPGIYLMADVDFETGRQCTESMPIDFDEPQEGD